MIIKLIRHGQSKANIGEQTVSSDGDHYIQLTSLGMEQSRNAVSKIGEQFFKGKILLYQSPHTRTRQTMANILIEANKLYGIPPRKIYEDPRLREMEWGYEDREDNEIDEMRKVHGKFWYRIERGENPADVYDRISTFLETMMRQIKRKHVEKVLIVSHGITIRVFVMRFMHLSVEQFDNIRNPKNCDIITISDKMLVDTQFANRKWMVNGLSFYQEKPK